MLTQNLSPKQIEAVNAIDEDVEIIACAGAGKTGVVTRRIVNILKNKPEVSPENIVAFTFTKKAAEELKSRIYSMGQAVLDNTQGFANMYIGTIHGFCLNMLREFLPQFQTFSVLDEVHTKLFVERYYEEIGMADLNMPKYLETDLFIRVMSLLNENWYDSLKWSAEVQAAFEKYQKKLYAERYFDYSLILREMVQQLESNLVFRGIVTEKVKYLTVDEYQDTNPVQERLVSLLKELGANLCVVGDDDQTIYQFRGSDSNNILTFMQRYNIKKYIVLDTDYRSTRGIVSVAKNVIVNNSRRLPKVMQSGCSTIYDDGDIVFKEVPLPDDEYEFIAQNIEKLHGIGIPYSEIAILLRKRKVGPEIAAVFDEHDIPFIIEGMNELLLTTECKAAKGIFEYLNGDIDSTELFKRWLAVDYPLNKKELSDCLQMLMNIDITKMKYYPELNLQQIYQDFLKGISLIEDGRPETEIILYNLGKFSQVIGDYEVINFTLKPKSKLYGFCAFLKYTAGDYYPEGYLTNSYTKPDAVSIMTVHQSKGLEYAAVFIPGLNKNFFPAQKVGGKNIWHIIQRNWITGSSRFDGDLEDERKLFYVAVTRAKKYLFISRAKETRDKTVSTFFEEAKGSPCMLPYNDRVIHDVAHLPDLRQSKMPLTLNFSLLQDYFECPYRFKLSMFYGFQQPFSVLMGYGNTLHEIIRNINIAAISGMPITDDFIQKTFDQVFYLPYATPKQRQMMLESAERGIKKYVARNASTFKDIQFAESQIEIDLGDGITVNGRIDMVKKVMIDGKEKTVIVDFKTANKRVFEEINSQQLRIYALGYQQLTGATADFIEIYHIDSENTARQAVDAALIEGIEAEIRQAADNIRRNNLPKQCNKDNCTKCRLEHLCLSKKELRNVRY
ncbi:ATP-dependent DNA helicase [Ruminococcus sp.]|uniref:ATP-dependent helicase n=1 Tax=Ruminococcus sp. TaxID=41978 RepID=UPI0025FBEE9F|nr:ATP-dependent DNA helicase [Ruminococcus sp.]